MDAILDLVPPQVAAYLTSDKSGYVYADTTTAAGLGALVDVSKPSLWIAAGAILFNPIYWNIVARNEYRKKTLTKMLGSNYLACYFLTVTIFSLGILRDSLYERALREQPHWKVLDDPSIKAVAVALFVVGQVFVVTSMWALGVTGTYLGDYCGILMSARVTGFPFNVLNDPMYVGSAMAFLGTALWFESPAGILLTVVVWIVYAIALKYEGPFTDMIYTNAAKEAEEKKKVAAAAKKAAAPTPVAPQTPRKSSRISSTTTAPATASATATATNGAATPRRRSRKSGVDIDNNVAASPMRVTRSRSKARMSETDDTD